MTSTTSMPETAPVRIPLIGEAAPAFAAHTTQGPISFPKDYAGKWVILFSHPADFTPVCTTEFMTFATMQPEFKALNCELVGLSIDSHFAHIAWLRTIKEKIKYKDMADVEVAFPLIADVKMDVAKAYGMVQPGASDTQAVRAVFVIDPKAIIRAVLFYPLLERAQFPGNQTPPDRAANLRRPRLRHARRLAARRRCHRAAARLLRHRQATHGKTGLGRLRAGLVHDV